MASALVWDSKQQGFISDEHRRVAEVIRDFDHELDVVYVPPEKRAFNDDQPFALVHSPLGQVPYVVRRLSYAELNPGLVAWVFNNDQRTTNVAERLDNMYKAQQAVELKKQMEERERVKEIATTILKSPLNTYRHDGVIYR